MDDSIATSPKIDIRHFPLPKVIISKFVARRTVRGAALWGLVFGVYVASKAIGFVDVYPTAAARQKIAETFSNNVGIELLLGRAPHAATTAAYVAWNTLGVMVTIGGIWAFLLTTKYFRGEEDSGRWEILLSGQTTARRAAINTFSGLGASLGVFYAVMAVIFIFVGKSHGVDFGVSSSLFFALAAILGITMFITIGSLASQLMSTRSRAATLSAAVLGICFLMRAIADITNLHWLLDINPLGWVEKLQPLSGSHPLWLLPILGLIVVLGTLTIFFAGRRDLGVSIFADKATAKPHTRLLNSPLAAALRLARMNAISWLAAVFISSTLYGLITKSTAQVFSQSKSVENVLTRLDHQTQVANAAFLGIVFFLQMVLIMAYAASSIVAIRRDEAEGYVDNFLVRPVSRIRWLSGRVFLILAVISIAGLLTSIGTWIGIVSQHTGISFHTLLLSSINVLAAVVLIVGAGVFALGIRPRLTSLIAYGVLAWSFLIETVSSGLNINHWILDTSVVHHIVLMPAATANWSTDLIIVLIGVALCMIGVLRFNDRDLELE